MRRVDFFRTLLAGVIAADLFIYCESKSRPDDIIITSQSGPTTISYNGQILTTVEEVKRKGKVIIENTHGLTFMIQYINESIVFGLKKEHE